MPGCQDPMLSFACTRGCHLGARLRPELLVFLSLGGPGGPGNLAERCGPSPTPTFWQGFPGSRGFPDSNNLGFSVFIWPPHQGHPPLPCSVKAKKRAENISEATKAYKFDLLAWGLSESAPAADAAMHPAFAAIAKEAVSST